ncbi:MAG: DUF1592 domain-containing protein [Deltaproteobacteria bacterium]|jgi:hypothetical protein|nr:DUF1592 domain-containing protein [Deltaproteobacteria bacterium]
MTRFRFRAKPTRAPWVLLLVFMAAHLLACEENADGTVGAIELTDLAPGSDYAQALPGEVAMRRLTQAQFVNSVTDVFGSDVVVPKFSEPDTSLGGLLSVGASQTAFSARGVESIEDAAYGLSEQALDTDVLKARLVPCSPSATVDDECALQTIESLGRLLWRRSLTDEESQALVLVAGQSAAVLGDFYDGLEFAIAGLLQSPNFLYRIEAGIDDASSVSGRAFTGTDMAARLSFFLWNSTPDHELLSAGESGELLTREGLFAHATRLLDSDRAREGVRNFFSEFLQLYELEHLSKDPTIFEQFNDELGKDAAEETLQLIDYLVFDLEGDYRELLTTRETFVNPRLAAIYNIPAPSPDGFAYTLMPQDGPRTGILGHVSFLAGHAHQVSSSATLRGKAVRTILLCQSIPAPPVDVDTSIPEPSGNTLTLRDRVAEHLENPSCAACHIMTDPIGLGLENFDSIGRWRDTDNGANIDASGDLDGVLFENPVGLGTAVGEHPSLAKCLVQRMSRYAMGRFESNEERAVLRSLQDRFEFHGYRVKPLMMEIIMSPLFENAGSLIEEAAR